MSIKKALFIIFGLFFVLVSGFSYIWLSNLKPAGIVDQEKADQLKVSQTEIDAIIEKKKARQALDASEEAVLAEYVGQIVAQRVAEIEKKGKGDVLSQAEVDFIMNPESSVLAELGVDEQKEVAKVYTQEEVDAIMNGTYQGE